MALKGHAIIELTNVHTGEKEIRNEDNLITNAISKIYNEQMEHVSTLLSSGFSSSTISYNDFTELFGGILLFSEPLNEDPEEIYQRDKANPDTTVGYACQTNEATTDPKRGNIITNESGATTNGWKYTYEFGTTQGNGKISSVALTSNLCGEHGLLTKGVYSNGYSGAFVKHRYVGIDESYNINSINISNVPYTYKITQKEGSHITISTPLSNMYLIQNNLDVVLLYFYDSSTRNIQIYQLNNDLVTWSKILDKTYESSVDSSKMLTSVFCAIGDYYYKDTGTSLIKFDKNGDWIKDIAFSCSYIYLRPDNSIASSYRYSNQIFYNDNVYISNDDNDYIYDNGYYQCGNTNHVYNNFIGRKVGGLYPNYLATINNLESPVVKTSDKTMKITYTLTYE